MAKRLQLRRGTTAEHASFTGAVGEITVDTAKNTVVVHPGSVSGGGHELVKASTKRGSFLQNPIHQSWVLGY
tara:strand:+ start:374 stop:589 length:216 start_codon:yes stop_codon:yes gene_type:complete